MFVQLVIQRMIISFNYILFLNLKMGKRTKTKYKMNYTYSEDLYRRTIVRTWNFYYRDHIAFLWPSSSFFILHDIKKNYSMNSFMEVTSVIFMLLKNHRLYSRLLFRVLFLFFFLRLTVLCRKIKNKYIE